MIIKMKGFLVIEKYFKQNYKNKLKSKCFSFILVAIISVNLFMFCSVALYPKGGFNILRDVRNSIDRSD